MNCETLLSLGISSYTHFDCIANTVYVLKLILCWAYFSLCQFLDQMYVYAIGTVKSQLNNHLSSKSIGNSSL